jgi:hypothetical protein
MDIEKLDLSNPATWTKSRIIDQFISDVLLPDKKESHRSKVIYEVFKDYCEQMEFGIPCSIPHFGKHLSSRFQSKRINGVAHYFCCVKPELLIRE